MGRVGDAVVQGGCIAAVFQALEEGNKLSPLPHPFPPQLCECLRCTPTCASTSTLTTLSSTTGI